MTTADLSSATDSEHSVEEQNNREGSDTDEGFEIEEGEGDALSDDFMTDDDSEHESGNDSEDISWTPPANWDELKRKQPALTPFGEAVWHRPSRRESLPDIVSQPPRAETFHIEPTGDHPLRDMFLDALPLEFWEETCEQILLYAEQQGYTTCMTRIQSHI